MAAQHELNCDNNGHANMNRESTKSLNPRQSNYQNYLSVRNAEKRNSLFQGSAQQVVIQYQVVSPGNVHTNNIKQSRLYLCMYNIYEYIHIYKHTINEKRL